MSPGREPENTDALGIDPPLGCAGTNQADRSRSILQRRRMLVAGTVTVLENKSCYTDRVEPFRNRSSFMIRKVTVPASRTNDDRSTNRFVFGRPEWSDRWNVIYFPADRTWCSQWPEKDGFFNSSKSCKTPGPTGREQTNQHE